MIEDIEQKLHMCHMQTEWIEEKIQKFGEKMDMAETEKQKKELEKLELPEGSIDEIILSVDGVSQSRSGQLFYLLVELKQQTLFLFLFRVRRLRLLLNQLLKYNRHLRAFQHHQLKG